MIIRQLGLQNYELVLLAMKHFTNQRTINTEDEIWLVQHPPVFTQGKNNKIKKVINSDNIPTIHSNRGGKVTFHGPGQQIMYVLLNLNHYKLKIRDLISLLEKTVIMTLSYFSINAHIIPEAPGVYVNFKKICSLGLHIKKYYSSHGLALNVEMDLKPFLNINPCGYTDLKMTQIKDFISNINIDYITLILIQEFLKLIKVTYKGIVSWNYSKYKSL